MGREKEEDRALGLWGKQEAVWATWCCRSRKLKATEKDMHFCCESGFEWHKGRDLLGRLFPFRGDALGIGLRGGRQHRLQTELTSGRLLPCTWQENGVRIAGRELPEDIMLDRKSMKHSHLHPARRAMCLQRGAQVERAA